MLIQNRILKVHYTSDKKILACEKKLHTQTNPKTPKRNKMISKQNDVN